MFIRNITIIACSILSLGSIAFASPLRGKYEGRVELKNFAQAVFQLSPALSYKFSVQVQQTASGYRADDELGTVLELPRISRNIYSGASTAAYSDEAGVACQRLVETKLTARPSQNDSLQIHFVTTDICEDGAFAVHIYSGTLKKSERKKTRNRL